MSKVTLSHSRPGRRQAEGAGSPPTPARGAVAKDTESMSDYRPLLKALYLVGILVIVSSLSDPIVQVWPLRFGNTAWRFGAAGLFSMAVTGVLLGIGWIMAVSAVLQQRRVLRSLSVLSFLIVVVLVAAAVLFGLDFLQVRAGVNPRLRGSLDVTVLRAVTMIGISVLVSLLLGIAAWRSSRLHGRRSSAAAKSPGIIYRTQTEGGSPAAAGEGAVPNSPRNQEET